MSGFVSEIFVSFQGEGVFAGRKHLFLRLAGCNLRCRYCDTPESLVRTETCRVPEGGDEIRTITNPLGAEQVAALLSAAAAAERGVHALAVTGGEPLLQVDFLEEVLPGLDLDVPVLLETNGMYPERFERIRSQIDIVSMDIKLPSNSGERGFWTEHEAFLELARGRTAYVKVPVDDATVTEEVERAVAIVARVDRRTPFFLQPILSPAARLEAATKTLERFYDIASEELLDVRVLPQAHRFLGIR